MQPGDQFNPRNRFVGLWLPDALARFRDISHGAKLTYARLCWHIDEYSGTCAPDTQTLADGIGVSLRQLMTYLKELQTAGFIRSIRRGLGMTNTYVFLWHPIFEENAVRRISRRAESSTSDMQKAAHLHMQSAAGPSILSLESKDLESAVCHVCRGSRIVTRIVRGTGQQFPCPACASSHPNKSERK